MHVSHPRHRFLRVPTARTWMAALTAACVLPVTNVVSQPAKHEVTFIDLPPLRVHGRAAHAHTQGLEKVGQSFYVTARQDDATPRRALLLRIEPTAPAWEVWDITPLDGSRRATSLDHPGGLQSDGERLWVPVAESQRGGRTLIRVYRIAALIAGAPAEPELEIEVHDHVGALAVDVNAQRILGAAWDTERVYVWGQRGRLERVLTQPELRRFDLGADPELGGVAVQDWKVQNGCLYASGLWKSAAPAESPSRLAVFEEGWPLRSKPELIPLPSRDGIELAREGMTVAGGLIYFLPADLGVTNRIFQVSLARLRSSKPDRARP